MAINGKDYSIKEEQVEDSFVNQAPVANLTFEQPPRRNKNDRIIRQSVSNIKIISVYSFIPVITRDTSST